ncbi:MAG TPA: hypothetical protein QGF58_07585 [Myxococcota bacterium]|nr:hypothetical protein [Myxococcota bacterium]
MEDGTCQIVAGRQGPDFDLDGDGVSETSLGTEPACTAASGHWDGSACWLRADLDGTWLIDHYTEPYGNKSHYGDRIAFYDSPGLAFWPGAKMTARFIPWVRGTDGTWCYARVDLDVDIDAGTEELELKETQVGANELPI